MYLYLANLNTYYKLEKDCVTLAFSQQRLRLLLCEELHIGNDLKGMVPFSGPLSFPLSPFFLKQLAEFSCFSKMGVNYPLHCSSKHNSSINSSITQEPFKDYVS